MVPSSPLSCELKYMPRALRNTLPNFWHARPTVGVYTMGARASRLSMSRRKYSVSLRSCSSDRKECFSSAVAFECVASSIFSTCTSSDSVRGGTRPRMRRRSRSARGKPVPLLHQLKYGGVCGREGGGGLKCTGKMRGDPNGRRSWDGTTHGSCTTPRPRRRMRRGSRKVNADVS